MEDEVKFYLFYLKEDDKYELYAHTLSKELSKKFEAQRNMKVFKKKVKTMDKFKAGLFNNEYKSKRLAEFPLYDGKSTMTIIGTEYEDTELSESITYMETCLADALATSECIPFNSKSKEIIGDVCAIVNEKNFELAINTFNLFYELHKKTF